MNDGKYSIGRSYNRVFSAIFGNWWLLPSVVCSFLAFFIVEGNTPIADFLGLRSVLIEGLLLEMTILILMPMSAVIWWHIRKDDQRKLKLKKRFLKAHSADKLVVFKYDPQRVYKVVSPELTDSEIEVTPVWTADGPVVHEQKHISEASAFSDFDAAIFLNR